MSKKEKFLWQDLDGKPPRRSIKTYTLLKKELMWSGLFRGGGGKNLPEKLMELAMDVSGSRVGWKERVGECVGEECVELVMDGVIEALGVTEVGVDGHRLDSLRVAVAKALFEY